MNIRGVDRHRNQAFGCSHGTFIAYSICGNTMMVPMIRLTDTVNWKDDQDFTGRDARRPTARPPFRTQIELKSPNGGRIASRKRVNAKTRIMIQNIHSMVGAYPLPMRLLKKGSESPANIRAMPKASSANKMDSWKGHSR